MPEVPAPVGVAPPVDAGEPAEPEPAEPEPSLGPEPPDPLGSGPVV